MYITPKIIDKEDGSYIVKYRVPEECKCEVEVAMVEEGKEIPIRGAKHVSSFVAKGNAKTSNEFDGPITANYLTSQLQEISKFLDSSRDNIEIRNKPINEDVNELLKVMNSLKSLEDRRDEINLTLDRIDEVLRTYEKVYDKKKEAEGKKCHKLMEESKTIAHVATRVEKEITVPKSNEAVKTKERIKKFEDSMKEAQMGLKKESFYYYDTGVEASFERIDEVKEKIKTYKETLQKFIYYEEMFKFTESETNGSAKIIDTIETEVNWMYKLWEHIKKCQDRFDEYMQLKWNDMDINEMEEQVKKMRTGLQPIKIADRKCNTFVGISEEIKRWGIFIPMIADLKHESMTTPDNRHWTKVCDTLKQSFAVDNSLELKKLWNLRIFDYKDTIE